MNLTALVEEIENRLLNSDPSNWSSIVVGTGALVPIKAIDPRACFREPGINLYLIPEFVEFSIGDSGRREFVKVSRTIKFVTTVITKKYESKSPIGDATTWSEGRQLIDLREELDRFLIAQDWRPMVIQDFLTEPPDEFEQEARYFVSVTQLGFGTQEPCGPGPHSSSRNLNAVSRLGRKRVSTESQVLSAQQFGPSSE